MWPEEGLPIFTRRPFRADDHGEEKLSIRLIIRIVLTWGEDSERLQVALLQPRLLKRQTCVAQSWLANREACDLFYSVEVACCCLFYRLIHPMPPHTSPYPLSEIKYA